MISTRVTQRAWHGLDKATVGVRERNAAAIFFVGRQPLPEALSTSAYFAATAHHWASNPTKATGYHDAFDVGLEHCPPPRRVLDLGTGAGGSAARVAGRFPQAEVIGVDRSRRMLRRAQAAHRRDNLEFRRGSVTKLPSSLDRRRRSRQERASAKRIVSATPGVTWPRWKR